jgi:hypothetical protein
MVSSTVIDARSVDYFGTYSTPMRLEGGSDSCISGGSISGTWPLSTAYSTISDTFGIAVHSSNFLIENYRVHNYGECISVWTNAQGFEVRGAYCTQIRNNLVSDKNSWGGLIEDSLFDGGSNFFNDLGAASAPVGAVVTIRNNVVRLQSFDQTYWGTPGHGWFWKQDTTAPVKLRLHGNILMAEQAGLLGQTLNPNSILSCKKSDGSPDNIIVWLGAGPYPYQSELDTGCFALSTDRNVYDQAAADWKARHGY